MGLSQSIVVVNEFTIKGPDGKGTRGSSPGDYIVGYMAREGATEDVSFVRLKEEDGYILRYMARESAVDEALSVPELKDSMRGAQKYAGVAFGYGDVSLSHEKLMFAKDDIQRQFDKGKPVFKTVLSFTEEYLKENGIIEEDFEFHNPGDYRGNIDQMKLRMAVMNGLDKMSKGFDDLQYIGVVQVDTAHVHIHLSMADRGEGRLRSDGKQDGRLTSKDRKKLRRGIDMALDENQTVRQLSSNVTHDKRNALCFIKRFTHETMAKQGMPQLLLATLPEDDTMWRAGSNRKEMKKPNAIVREYVIQVLAEPNSGYRDALRSVDTYARTRQTEEDLTDEEYRELYRNGQERIVTDCMNGVYAVLRQIPKEERSLRTPMMDVMSMPYEDMSAEADSDPMVEFGFKLRSYKSRLDHHRKERHKYHEAVETYETTQNVSEDSRPLYDFLKHEEEYQAKCMCKYHHFLSFLPPEKEYEEDFDDLVSYRRKLRNMREMRRDKSIKRMKPENAEDYGLRVYEQHGGQYAVTAPQILERREALMEQTYTKKEQDFATKLADYGLTLDSDDTGVRVSTKKPYAFDDVKALDLHHMGYDFSYDAPVSKPNVDEFVAEATLRYQLYQEAAKYLIASDQRDSLKFLPGKDIQLMKDVADRMRVDPVLPTVRSDEARRHRGTTVRLGVDYTKDMELAVRSTVQAVQMGDV